MSNSVEREYRGLFSRLCNAKSSISLIFFVYCISILSQLILSLSANSSYAASPTTLTRLIAVLVDTSVYRSYQAQVDWYASQYLQTQYSNSKALVIPIEAANFQAQDIHKMLQNLYFEGEKNQPTQLIGVTLVGNIALPVVNDNSYYYPTIYPYTDFVNPQFVYSEQERTFIVNPQGVDQNPELRHNFIRFESNEEYGSYFLKLSQYASNPKGRVSDKVWVDNIVEEQKSYDQGALNNYANQFVFGEDIGRQRYTNLLLDVTNAQEGNKVYDMFSGISKTTLNNSNLSADTNELPSDLSQQQQDAATNLKGYFQRLAKLANLLSGKKTPNPNTFDTAKVGELNSSQGVPTLFLQEIMDGYLRNYPELYSEEYHTSINNLVDPSGRYYNSGDTIGINSHIWKTYQHDELTKAIVINLNDQLEKTVDDFVESERLYMTVPVPTKKLSYRAPKGSICGGHTNGMILDDIFDVSYFGSDPWVSQSFQDMMIFRGTFLNLTGVAVLSGYDYRNVPFIDKDSIANRSVGASYGIQSREVEANRGYNVTLVESDQNYLPEIKNMILAGENECNAGQLEDQNKYIERYWGGYTPMNIDPTYIQKYGSLSLNLTKLDYTAIWSPSYAVNGATFGGTVFDIAGSKMINPTYRKLGIVQGTQEYLTTTTTDPNRVAPEDCSGAVNQYITNQALLESVTVEYSEKCTNNGDQFCQMLQDDITNLTQQIQDFENSPDSNAQLDRCLPTEFTTAVEVKPQTKKDVSLSGLSDNFTGYTQFIAVQRTAYRPDLTFRRRGLASHIEYYLRKFKGQDGLNFSIAKAVESRTVKPILYCNSNSKKKIYAYDEVNFFKQIVRNPVGGEKIRILINNGSGNVVSNSQSDLDRIEACEVPLKTIADKEELIITKSQEAKSLAFHQIKRKIEINKEITNLQKEVDAAKNDNPQCFTNFPLYNYEVWKAACNGNGGYKHMYDYYYKTLPTTYVHKSPTAEELYGKELKLLRGIQLEYAVPDASNMRKVGKRRQQYNINAYTYNGLKFEVDSISFVLSADEYTLSPDKKKVYFANTTSLNLYGKEIPLKNVMGIFSGTSMLTLTGSDAPLTRLEQEQGGRKPWIYPRYGGMNMGTSDRPIDSVRYTSFQGIGGDLVTFVYPNLYNVSVFDASGKLKTEEQIKQSIKEYLTKQAQLYRQQLQAQQDKSQTFYNAQKKAFDTLAQSDKLASPNRVYNISKVTDDFFIKGLAMKVGSKQFSSDDVLAVLARNLYYQNLISPGKVSSNLLDKDLDNLYKTIALDNVNSKRKFVFDTYLTYDSDKTTGGISRVSDWTSLSGLLLPAYDPKGYEITSITSDGSDYHVDPTLNPLLKQFQIVSDMTKAAPRQDAYQENLAPLVCGGKTYQWGGVPILQYPKAFQCWLEDVKDSSVTITVNGDLVDLIKTIDELGRKAALTGYFADQINYANQRTNYADQLTNVPAQRGSLIDSATNMLSPGSGTSLAADYQKWRANNATMKGLDELNNSSVYDATTMTESERMLSQIINSLSIDIGSNQLAIDGSGVLNVASIAKTSSPYNISISGTGSACIVLNGTNTCHQPVTITNWGGGSEKIAYKLSLAAGAKLGDSGLLFRICTIYGNVCATYPVIYTIIPGQLAHIKVIDILNGGYLARGSQMPLVIQGYDRDNRPVSLAPDPYRMSIDHGNLLYMSQSSKSFDINTWGGLTVVYDSNGVKAGVDRISIKPVYADGLLPVLAYDIVLAEPVLNLTTRQGPRQLSDGISITLPSEPNTLTKPIGSGDLTLVPDKVPMIRLGLDEIMGRPVMGTVQISSQNGLVKAGVIGSQMISGSDGRSQQQYVWSDQDSFVLTGTSQEIYLYPSYRAGKDVIQVKMGDTVRSIPLTVNSGNPAGVTIKAPERLSLGQTGWLDFTVTDYWGNQLSTDTWLDLASYGYLFTMLDSTNPISRDTKGAINGIQTVKGSARISVVPKAIIGKGYVTAQVRGIALDKQRGDYAGVLVQSTLWPTKKINSLVLELKGSDWGAVSGMQSVQTIKAPSLITQSNKLLSVVTNLADASQLRQSQLILNPHGGIYGDQALGAKLSVVQGNWNVVTHGDLHIIWDKTAGYRLNQATTGILTTKPAGLATSAHYVPMVQDSIVSGNHIDNGRLLINNIIVLDPVIGMIHPDLEMRYIDDTDYGAGVYDVLYRGKTVGNLILYRSDMSLLSQMPTIKTQLPGLYDVMTGYVGGSTRGDVAVHIVTRDSNYEISDTEQSPGNHLIAQFGQGRSVGDAVQYYDQFSITYGDAALSKTTLNVPAYALVSDNGKPVAKNLPYDTGIGQLIYNNPDEAIDRVVSIDFNNDKLKDLLIVYTNGSVRLLKNYGGKDPWRDLGHLMIIADGIQDLYVGDVDKNNYQDIIVYTQEGKLRVYYNNRGEFDVDGYPVCLGIPGGPDDLSQLYYWTIRDMDLDGGVDITTYDYNGDIKVFYGGRSGTSDGSSYVSNDHALCDPKWKDRQQSTLVQSFGMNLISSPLKDDSLLHWATHSVGKNPYDQPPVIRKAASDYTNFDSLQTLEDSSTPTLTSSSDISNAGIKKTSFESGLPQESTDYKADTFGAHTASNALNSVNISQITNSTYSDSSRYIPVPNSVRPVYQTKGNTLYIPINRTVETDPFTAVKVFTDLNGGVLVDRDLVEIKITIRGTPGVQFAYLDKLTGPWVVPITQAGKLEGASADFMSLNQYIKYNTDGYIFSINGAPMASDGVLEFSYIVQYRSEKLANVEVISTDTYPMIEASSIDGCQKTQWQFNSLGGSRARIYSAKTINYNNEIINQQTQSYTAYDQATQKQTKEIISSLGKEDGVFDYLKERRNSDNVFQRSQGIIDGTYLQSIPTNFRIGLQSGAKEQEISRSISEFTNNLCNGFKVGSASCAGTTPPIGIPFNMAFPPLTPGTVNVMGYKVFEDKGLPLLAFPTSAPIPIWPPNPSGAGGWFGSESSTSQFRFYMTPTLTTALGFAFCFGPYGVGVKLPAPFKNVVGNCIVIATQPLLKGQQQCAVQSDPDYTPPAQPDLPTCYGNLQTDLSKVSPTQMVTFDLQTQAWLEEQRLTSPSDLYYNATYYGGDAWKMYGSAHPGVAKAIQASNSVIHLNQPARIGDSAEVFSIGAGDGTSIGDVGQQLGGLFSKKAATRKETVRTIGKGVSKGIGACIMQIADNQIQYVKNNLLTSSLTVILPDMTNLGLSNDWSSTGVRSDVLQIKQNIDEINKQKQELSGSTQTQTEKSKDPYESNLTTTGAKESMITTLSQTDLNPFYRVEQLFNDVKLISISHKDINLTIPYIRETELSMYRSQLVGRAERNEEIIKQWDAYGSGLTAECNQLSEPESKKECKNLLSQVAYINKQFGQMEKSYRSNLVAIDQYVHFQTTLLPNWKEQHVVYLTELTNVVNSTMSQLAGRSTQNAARFTSWTSAIRSMIVAVKTWQLLIDFSVNWKEKCGTCRIDNYDFATCSLNGLCPNFPLFAWPNFRTPDFTIDLSHIDAGVDIVVPNFRFTPTNVPLYRLINIPDLPLPPKLGGPYIQLNVILPTLPVLPSPPTLPTLPSLSMNVDMDLPLLPPAPKIPMLPETLNAALEVAEFIGQILCIVKGKVGLVGEKFVKQKIEQITARTREVSPFDSITTVWSEPRPQGYNARLDTYVNLRFYFDGLYNLFDVYLGQQWNLGMGEVQQDFLKLINEGSQWVNGWIASGMNAINSGLNEVGLPQGPVQYNGSIVPLSSAEFDARIVTVLNQFGMAVEDQRLANKAREIAGLVQKPLQTQPNIDGIERVRNQAEGILQGELTKAQSEYDQIKYHYDEWLDSLTTDQYVSDVSQTTDLSTSLYTINPEVAEIIESSDIMGDYLQGNKQLLDRYTYALENNDANSLNMDESDYQESREYISQMNELTNTALSQHKLLSIDTLQEKTGEGPGTVKPDPEPDPELPTNPTGTPPSNTVQKVGFDQTTQRDGYLVETVVDVSSGGKIKAAVDVIKPEGLGTQYRETSLKEDMNGTDTQKPDIVLWDSTSVYIKYADQKDIHGAHNTTKNLYRIRTLTSPAQLEQLTRNDEGYLGYDPGLFSFTQWYKLWSTSYAVTNFHLQGQEYESAVFQWTNPDVIGQPRNEIYLLRFTTLVDRFPDWLGPNNQTRYILVVPAGASFDPVTTKVQLPSTTVQRTVKFLLDEKMVHDVVHYDPSAENIVALMRNLSRKRHYAGVLRMELINNAYTRTSPWSNQDVGGYQIAADSVAPIPEVKLVRVATKQTVGGGTSMQGYINTNYDLIVTWKDNVSISRTSVGGTVQPGADKVVVTKIYEQIPKTLNYSFGAVDSSNNVTTINVTVTIQHPELETVAANANSGSWGTITAKLTPDLDDGVVKFQKNNGPSRTTLTATPSGVDGYIVQPGKTMFTGGLYQFPNSWGLVNPDGSNGGTIGGGGQITTQNLSLLVKFPQGYPVINMINASGVVMYELTYAPETLTGSVPIDIKTPSKYRLLSLGNFNAAIAGAFAGGWCVAPQVGECEMYVSTKGDIWVDPAVRNNYYGTYLWRNGHGVYQIMRDNTFVAEVNLVIKSLQ